MSSRAVRDERRLAFTNDLCRRRFKDARSATGIPALISRTLPVVGGVILIAGLVVAWSGKAGAGTGGARRTEVKSFPHPGTNLHQSVTPVMELSQSTSR